MDFSLKELLQPREYDFRIQPSGHAAPSNPPDFRTRYQNALHASQQPVHKTYTANRVQMANKLTQLLYTVAAFYGGRLECSTRQKELYRCKLLLEAPLVFLREDGEEDRMATLLHQAVQLSEQFFLDSTNNGWLQLHFLLNLTAATGDDLQ